MSVSIFVGVRAAAVGSKSGDLDGRRVCIKYYLEKWGTATGDGWGWRKIGEKGKQPKLYHQLSLSRSVCLCVSHLMGVFLVRHSSVM